MAASGLGKKAWEWINQVEREGQTFDGLEDPTTQFISLDQKLCTAFNHILTGNLASDIFNRTEAMSKENRMISGRQIYFVVLSHLEYDRLHGFTYNILSIQQLHYEGDGKLEHFVRKYESIINGLSTPIAEDILRLQLFDKIKNSQILAHDIAWFRRSEDPSSPDHATVYTHSWLKKIIHAKIKSQELDVNAASVLKTLNQVTVPGAPADAPRKKLTNKAVSYTHLTLPTTPYV